MNYAATEVRKVDGGQQVTANEVVSSAISTDVTWQKRGFSSRNGVVTIIANGSIIQLKQKLAKHFPIGKVRLVQNLRNLYFWRKVGKSERSFLMHYVSPYDT